MPGSQHRTVEQVWVDPRPEEGTVRLLHQEVKALLMNELREDEDLAQRRLSQQMMGAFEEHWAKRLKEAPPSCRRLPGLVCPVAASLVELPPTLPGTPAAAMHSV